MAESYYKQGDMAVDKIALEIGVSKMTLYKYLRYRKVPIGSYVHQDNSKKLSDWKSASYILWNLKNGNNKCLIFR